MTMAMTPSSITPNHMILKVMNPIPQHLRTLQTMLKLISPCSRLPTCLSVAQTQSISITLSNGEALARSALALASAEKPINLTGVPEEYHDFADVFSEVKANKLPPHRPYNLKINIEEGSILSARSICYRKPGWRHYENFWTKI